LLAAGHVVGGLWPADVDGAGFEKYMKANWGIHLTGVGLAAAAGARRSSMASSPASGPDSAGGPSPAAA